MFKSPAQLYLLPTVQLSLLVSARCDWITTRPFRPRNAPLSPLTQEAEAVSQWQYIHTLAHPVGTLLQSSFALAVPPRHTAACFHSSIPCVRKFLKNANYRFCQKAKTRQSNKKKKMVWACATYTRTCNYYIITPPLDRVSPNHNEQTTMLFNPPLYYIYMYILFSLHTCTHMQMHMHI